jgi:competence protein ComEA
MRKLFALLLAIVSFLGMAFAAVNINTANQQELESLKGIGPVRAKAIISYREKHGPFKTLEEVDKVPGIGKGTLEKIKGDVIFAGPTTSLGPDAKPKEKAKETKVAQRETKKEEKPSAKTETTTAEQQKAKESEKKASTKSDEKKPTASSGALVDINHASQKELEALPGIGEARAKAIIKGRPYKGKDDLVAKGVVPESVYKDIKDQIVARQK